MKIDPKYKYIDHDIHIEDISESDLLWIKSYGVDLFVNTKEGRQIPLIISSFMDYLTSKGYRIIKKEIEDV